jgi:hypothetical protein
MVKDMTIKIRARLCSIGCAIGSTVALLATGCTYSIHQVQVSDFQPYAPLERGDIVKGYGEQFVILGITNETNYVEAAYKNLMNNCPAGSLSGITTQISTAHGFFSWTNKALMQGLCIKASEASAPATASSRRRKPAAKSSGAEVTGQAAGDWISEEI